MNELLTVHMGPEFVLVNISVKSFPRTDADAMEGTIDFMEDGIKRSNPRVRRVFTEAESRGAPRRD